MKYRELKDQRDEALARAIEAERLSMKSEFDRVQAEAEAERERLLQRMAAQRAQAYDEGFQDGARAMANKMRRIIDSDVTREGVS